MTTRPSSTLSTRPKKVPRRSYLVNTLSDFPDDVLHILFDRLCSPRHSKRPVNSGILCAIADLSALSHTNRRLLSFSTQAGKLAPITEVDLAPLPFGHQLINAFLCPIRALNSLSDILHLRGSTLRVLRLHPLTPSTHLNDLLQHAARRCPTLTTLAFRDKTNVSPETADVLRCMHKVSTIEVSHATTTVFDVLREGMSAASNISFHNLPSAMISQLPCLLRERYTLSSTPTPLQFAPINELHIHIAKVDDDDELSEKVKEARLSQSTHSQLKRLAHTVIKELHGDINIFHSYLLRHARTHLQHLSRFSFRHFQSSFMYRLRQLINQHERVGDVFAPCTSVAIQGNEKRCMKTFPAVQEGVVTKAVAAVVRRRMRRNEVTLPQLVRIAKDEGEVGVRYMIENFQAMIVTNMQEWKQFHDWDPSPFRDMVLRMLTSSSCAVRRLRINTDEEDLGRGWDDAPKMLTHLTAILCAVPSIEELIVSYKVMEHAVEKCAEYESFMGRCNRLRVMEVHTGYLACYEKKYGRGWSKYMKMLHGLPSLLDGVTRHCKALQLFFFGMDFPHAPPVATEEVRCLRAALCSVQNFKERRPETMVSFLFKDAEEVLSSVIS